MDPARSVHAYPWQALDSIRRPTVKAIQALALDLDPKRTLRVFATQLGQLLEDEVELVFNRYCDPEPTRASRQALHFSLEDECLELSVDVEPQLAAEILGRLLRQPAGVAGPDALNEPGARGLLARVIVEATRRSGLAAAPMTSADPPERTAWAALGVGATVIISGRPHALRASLARLRPAEPASRAANLGRLGALPVRVPLIGAICRVDRSALATLGEGDGLLPLDSWWLDQNLEGSIAMVPERTARGVFFEIRGPSSAKLAGVRGLSSIEEAFMSEQQDDELSESIATSVLEAPVVVRIEVASVTLSADAFANLRPGDVIETDRKIGELASLWAGGREIARGELVNVDGELGVRIRKLTQGA